MKSEKLDKWTIRITKYYSFLLSRCVYLLTLLEIMNYRSKCNKKSTFIVVNRLLFSHGKASNWTDFPNWKTQTLFNTNFQQTSCILTKKQVRWEERKSWESRQLDQQPW